MTSIMTTYEPTAMQIKFVNRLSTIISVSPWSKPFRFPLVERDAAEVHGASKLSRGSRRFACRAKHRRKWVTRDRFAEPVIGPANGRTRWLAMTAEMLSSNARHCHCEKRVARRSNLCHPDGLDAP